jgi:oligosaccharide repeat unit polymerase
VTILLLIIGGGTASLIGRWVFGRWFNQITLYSAVWSVTLIMFEARFIEYRPLESETWLVIITAWICFILGSVTVVMAQPLDWRTRSSKPISLNTFSLDDERRLLKQVLWALCLVSGLAVAQHWYVLLAKFKTVSNVLIYGNVLYSMRVSNRIEGAIPYLDALSLTACLFAGMYIAAERRPRLLAFLPLFISLAESFGEMGRAKLLIAVILYSSGYFLRRATVSGTSSMKRPVRSKNLLALGIVVLSIVLGAELIRSTRRPLETIKGSSTSLRKLQGASFVTPTVYLYFSVHHGVLNQYLNQKDENAFWGENTFGPVWRVLAKFGAPTEAPQYQRFYRTPVGANTGTYLREAHADFGDLGLLLVPYLLGLVTASFWKRWEIKRSYVSLALLSHFYVIVVTSYVLIGTRWGYWWMALIGALVVGEIFDIRLATLQRTDAARLPLQSMGS